MTDLDTKTEFQLIQISLAQETLNHVVFLNLLRVGAGTISTSVAKQAIQQGLEKFMRSLGQNGFLNVPVSYFQKEVTNNV